MDARDEYLAAQPIASSARSYRSHLVNAGVRAIGDTYGSQMGERASVRLASVPTAVNVRKARRLYHRFGALHAFA